MLELNNPKIEKTSLSNEASRINLNDYIIDLAWSPDGSRLAAASVEGDIFLIHTDSNILEYVKLGEHTGGANSLSWRHDGQEFASAGQDGFVKIWNGNSGEEICKLEAGSSWVEKVSYNPHSNVLASSAGRQLKLWTDQRSTL